MNKPGDLHHFGDYSLDISSGRFTDNNRNEFHAYDYGMTNEQVIREINNARRNSPFGRPRLREKATTTLTITSRHQMSKTEFDAIKGTNLFGDLYRNRQHVNAPALPMAGKETLFSKLAEELEESCKGLFYIDPGTSFIYFSETVDAVQFKLTNDGREEIVVYDVDR